MDRKHPEKLPAIQLSFIQHLVSPLFQACAEAGIIPGILETATGSERDNTSPTGKKEAEEGKTEGWWGVLSTFLCFNGGQGGAGRCSLESWFARNHQSLSFKNRHG